MGVGYFLAKKVGRWQQDRIRKKVLKTARERGSVLATYHKFLKEHEENKKRT